MRIIIVLESKHGPKLSILHFVRTKRCQNPKMAQNCQWQCDNCDRTKRCWNHFVSERFVSEFYCVRITLCQKQKVIVSEMFVSETKGVGIILCRIILCQNHIVSESFLLEAFCVRTFRVITRWQLFCVRTKRCQNRYVPENMDTLWSTLCNPITEA